MHPGYDDTAMENFLARVQQHGELTTREAAERATRGTLSALAESITGGQMADLAAGLPAPLRPQIEQASGHARPFDKSAFLDRVTGDVDTVDIDKAETQARAVLRTVSEWAPEGEIEDTLEQLPPELSQLFR